MPRRGRIQLTPGGPWLERLTKKERSKLQILQDQENSSYFKGGNEVIKACKRHKRRKNYPGWPSHKIRNRITEYPKWLSVCHVEFMLHYDVRFPKDWELCHGCLDVNLKKQSRRGSGANCIEPTHHNLGSRAENAEECVCQNAIKKFWLSNRANPKIETNGCITLAYVRKYDKSVKIRCPHNPICLGNFGDADKAKCEHVSEDEL